MFQLRRGSIGYLALLLLAGACLAACRSGAQPPTTLEPAAAAPPATATATPEPLAVASLPIPGGVHDIAIAGAVAMVTNAGSSEGGLWDVDLRQPSQPQVVGGTNLPAAGMRVAFGGEYGLVGSVGAGVGSFVYK